MGGCGVGKTHLAVALLQEIIRTGKPGKLLFSNFQDLIQQIHASFDSDETPSKSLDAARRMRIDCQTSC